jgi:hypothetical protein
MADTKITSLTGVATLGGNDEFVVNQGGNDRKVSGTQVLSFFQTKGSPIVFALAADHAISATAATEVTGLGPCTLPAGTYQFTFYIIAQSATTSVGIMFGVNFTGTAAVRVMKMRASTTGTTAISGVIDDSGATSGQTEESVATNAFSTTAPNMGLTGGVATANANVLVIIEGLLVVTASGDLELWHGSETATSTTVKAGTSLIVIRTA